MIKLFLSLLTSIVVFFFIQQVYAQQYKVDPYVTKYASHFQQVYPQRKNLQRSLRSDSEEPDRFTPFLWNVYSKKEGVIFYQDSSSQKKKKISLTFLQPGRVIKLHENRMQVEFCFDKKRKSCNKRETGWVNMHDLILLDRSIRTPVTSVPYKSFLKKNLSLSNISQQQIGIDEDLRPKLGGSHSQISLKGNSGMIWYVYAVAYDNDSIEPYIKCLNSNIKDKGCNIVDSADWLLLGASNQLNRKNNSMWLDEKEFAGWYKNHDEIIVWNHRMALEPVDDDKENGAHLFIDRSTLNYYYDKKSGKTRKNYLNENAENITINPGIFRSGNDLRYLITCDKESLCEDVQKGIVSSFSIGYVPSRQKNTRRVVGHQASDVNFSTMTTFQKEASKLNVFFLMDATSSMQPSLDGISTLVKQIQIKLRNEYQNIEFSGAVYRDNYGSSGLKNRSVKEYQNLPKGVKLSDVLSKIIVGPGRYDDYPESMFKGIRLSIEELSDYGTNILFVLSDVGDNERRNKRGETEYNKLIKVLRNERYLAVIPVLIQHDNTITIVENECDNLIQKQEQSNIEGLDRNYLGKIEASKKFICDFRRLSKINKNIKVSEIVKVSPDINTEFFSGEISFQMREILSMFNKDTKHLYRFISQWKLGMIKNLARGYCQEFFKNIDHACLDVTSFEQLKKLRSTTEMANTSSAFVKQNLLLPQLWLNKLSSNQKLLRSIEKNPSSFFIPEAYVAWEDKRFNKQMTKPVLLLSAYEIDKLVEKVFKPMASGAIKDGGKFCGKDPDSIDAMIDFKEKISRTIYGELMSNSTKRYKTLSISASQYTIDEYIQKICNANIKTKNKYLKFLGTNGPLQTINRYIKSYQSVNGDYSMLSDKKAKVFLKEKQYTDASFNMENTKEYYWLNYDQVWMEISGSRRPKKW